MRTTIMISLLLGAGAAPAFAQDLAPMVSESREAVKGFAQRLGASLKKEMEAGGPQAAIGACKDVAPAIASEISRARGWKVSRVSLKNRNPVLGTPDAWEQNVLADFDRRAAAGEKPDTLEVAAIVDEPQGRQFRYMKAIPVQEVCLACHGPADNLQPAVRQRFSEAYPHDRATGYGLGQIRGAFTVKRPL